MSEPVPSTSTDQVPRERAAGQVSDVLLNLEHTLARAKKAHKIVAKDGVDTNVELALAEAIKDLERVRKRLQQDTYFRGRLAPDALRAARPTEMAKSGPEIQDALRRTTGSLSFAWLRSTGRSPRGGREYRPSEYLN